MPRSVDFGSYHELLKMNFPGARDTRLMLSLLQVRIATFSWCGLLFRTWAFISHMILPRISDCSRLSRTITRVHQRIHGVAPTGGYLYLKVRISKGKKKNVRIDCEVMRGKLASCGGESSCGGEWPTSTGTVGSVEGDYPTTGTRTKRCCKTPRAGCNETKQVRRETKGKQLIVVGLSSGMRPLYYGGIKRT